MAGIEACEFCGSTEGTRTVLLPSSAPSSLGKRPRGREIPSSPAVHPGAPHQSPLRHSPSAGQAHQPKHQNQQQQQGEETGTGVPRAHLSPVAPSDNGVPGEGAGAVPEVDAPPGQPGDGASLSLPGGQAVGDSVQAVSDGGQAAGGTPRSHTVPVDLQQLGNAQTSAVECRGCGRVVRERRFLFQNLWTTKVTDVALSVPAPDLSLDTFRAAAARYKKGEENSNAQFVPW